MKSKHILLTLPFLVDMSLSLKSATRTSSTLTSSNFIASMKRKIYTKCRSVGVGAGLVHDAPVAVSVPSSLLRNKSNHYFLMMMNSYYPLHSLTNTRSSTTTSNTQQLQFQKLTRSTSKSSRNTNMNYSTNNNNNDNQNNNNHNHNEEITKKKTNEWIQNVIIQLNLCPFAQQSKIFTSIVQGNDEDEIISTILYECIIRKDDIGTTSLIVCPDLYPNDFEKYLDVVDLMENVLVDYKLKDDIQVRFFLKVGKIFRFLPPLKGFHIWCTKLKYHFLPLCFLDCTFPPIIYISRYRAR